MTYKRKEIIGDCTLYLGDCLDVMPTLDKVNAVVTDPPYGVMLGEVKNGQAIRKEQKPYHSFSDTPEYVINVCVKAIEISRTIADVVAVTTGSRNMFKYPEPDDMGAWWNPAGTSRGRWGFQLLVTPILYYGRDPRAGVRSYASSVTGLSGYGGDKPNHPCPKPLRFMEWLVKKASLEGQTVLDPFMGSGTTGVACAKLGRKFIGIELEEKYFNIACKRIEEAYLQPDLFVEPPKVSKQEELI